MSSDFLSLKLDDVIHKRNQGVNTTTEKVEYSNSGIKVVRANNIGAGNIDTTDCVFVDKETFARIKDSCKPKKGDILYTNIGSQFGNAAKVDFDLDFAIAWNVMRIQPKNNVDPDFLVYLLNFGENKSKIKSLNSSSTMPFVSGKEIGNTEFDFPSLETQKTVANALLPFDKKIKLNSQINQTLEQIAQAIFKSWFVDFDPVKAKIWANENGHDPERAAMCAIAGLPYTDDALDHLSPEQQQQLATTAALFPDTLEESELGEIPSGWDAKPLYETAEYVNGAAFKATDFSNEKEGLPIIKIAELKNGLSDSTKYSNNTYPEKYFIQDDDVMYSWSGSPETSLEVFKWFGGTGWLNQHIFKLNFKMSSQKYFTYFLLKFMKPVLIATAQQKQTTGLGHITVADMKRIKLPYPSLPLLNRFAEVVGPLYDKESTLQKQNGTLSKLRDTILPKLLSGELSVADLPEVADAK